MEKNILLKYLVILNGDYFFHRDLLTMPIGFAYRIECHFEVFFVSI